MNKLQNYTQQIDSIFNNEALCILNFDVEHINSELQSIVFSSATKYVNQYIKKHHDELFHCPEILLNFQHIVFDDNIHTLTIDDQQVKCFVFYIDGEQQPSIMLQHNEHSNILTIINEIQCQILKQI